MQKKATELKFEEAEILKQRYFLLNTFVAKSEVVSHTINDIDVFTITDDDKQNNAFINYIHVKNGTINQSFTYEYKRKLDETDEELLIQAIPEIRERFHSTAKEIIVPFEMEWEINDAVFFVPQRGDKHHLLELSELNGKQYKFDRLKQSEKLNPEQRQTRLMKELKEKLELPRLPMTIECFDNSNISGTDAVAGCVVFKKMKPSKKDYRKYNIKTVVGPDDYASMQEVVRRRYTRMQEEGTSLPDLIITDGGKGQMDVVKEVVVDEMHLDIPIAGLAKDNRHRTNELLYGFPPQVIGLKTDSELFHILTQIQDEVHRYAITFHRNKRSKHALHSELDDIKGLGPKGKEALIKKMHTVKQIKEADIQDIINVLGESKGTIVFNHFHDNNM
jgi:excinuclease ABC subunit C